MTPFEAGLPHWHSNEYPRILNMFSDYSQPPKLPNSATFEEAINYHAYKGCYEQYHVIKKQIDARDAAARQVAAQKIADQQKVLNDNYNSLLSQYQQLLQAYIAEKNAHAQETAELLRLKAEMARISNILRSVGLM